MELVSQRYYNFGQKLILFEIYNTKYLPLFVMSECIILTDCIFIRLINLC